MSPARRAALARECRRRPRHLRHRNQRVVPHPPHAQLPPAPHDSRPRHSGRTVEHAVGPAIELVRRRVAVRLEVLPYPPRAQVRQAGHALERDEPRVVLRDSLALGMRNTATPLAPTGSDAPSALRGRYRKVEFGLLCASHTYRNDWRRGWFQNNYLIPALCAKWSRPPSGEKCPVRGDVPSSRS